MNELSKSSELTPVPRPDQALTRSSANPISAQFAYPPEQPDSRFDILKYWGLFLKYRWLTLICVGVAICCGYGAVLLTTPTYRATATIEIDRTAQQVVKLADDQTDAPTLDEVQFYQTEYELLKSRSLAQRVAADLDLAGQAQQNNNGQSAWSRLHDAVFGAPPRSQPALGQRADVAVKQLMDNFSISPVPNSALVRLFFDSTDARQAQSVVNEISDAFIKTNLEHRYAATTYARNFLQDQIAQLKLKLEQSERALVGYAQKEQLVNIDGKQPLAAADLQAVNDQLAGVRADRIRNEQLWQQAQTTDGLGLPQILADPTIQELRQRRASLQSDYQNKLSTFKPDFPDMRQLRAQITEVDHQIKTSADLIKQSLQAKFEASKQQEALLAEQLTKNTNHVLDVQNRNIEYTILQREVDTNRTLYNALLQRYKDVGVAGGVGANNISIVDPAQLPAQPFSPNFKKDLGLALALGLLVAVALAYALELLDDTFKTPEQVEEALQMPVLGLTPKLGRSSPIADALADPQSSISEAYRSIRTAIQFSTETGAPKTMLITSAKPGEGKSTASLALARNFAQLGLKVLLVDSDLRNPSLHKALDCSSATGLSNYLAGNFVAGELAQETRTPGLFFISSGPLPPNPAELLAGPKLRAFLTAESQRFDLILLDGPPIMGLADALLLGSVADGTVLIVGAAETRRGVTTGALKRLHFARARVIGAVLSKFDVMKVGFAYGYGYGSGYGATSYYQYNSDTPRLPKEAAE